jgi:hypothetical protein
MRGKRFPVELMTITDYIGDSLATCIGSLSPRIAQQRGVVYEVFYIQHLNLFVIAHTDEIPVSAPLFNAVENALRQQGIKFNFVFRKVQEIQPMQDDRTKAFVPTTF